MSQRRKRPERTNGPVGNTPNRPISNAVIEITGKRVGGVWDRGAKLTVGEDIEKDLADRLISKNLAKPMEKPALQKTPEDHDKTTV